MQVPGRSCAYGVSRYLPHKQQELICNKHVHPGLVDTKSDLSRHTVLAILLRFIWFVSSFNQCINQLLCVILVSVFIYETFGH